jgi:hypothetical protein
MQRAKQARPSIQLRVTKRAQFCRHFSSQVRQDVALLIVNPEEARRKQASAGAQIEKQLVNEGGVGALRSTDRVANANNTICRSASDERIFRAGRTHCIRSPESIAQRKSALKSTPHYYAPAWTSE